MIVLRNGEPAVNVKDQTLYAHTAPYADLIDKVGERTAGELYEQVQGDFWSVVAPSIARSYGYGKVYSDGRSDGWLTVENPPDLDACDPCYGETGKCAECQAWEAFTEAIGKAMDALREQYAEDLRGEADALDRRREALDRRREAAIVRGYN